MIAALFGLVIFLDLKICSITLTGFELVKFILFNFGSVE